MPQLGEQTSVDYLSTSNLTTVTDLADVDDDDFDRVRKSWLRAVIYCQSRSIDLGVLIFSAVFAEEPKLRTIFGVPHDLDPEHLLPKNSSFKHHARVFVNMIDLVVRSCNDLENQVQAALVTYGGRHYTKHKVDFDNEYLAAFAKAIVQARVVQYNFTRNMQITRELNHLVTEADSSIRHIWDGRTEDVWHLITVYVVRQMKHGYDDEFNMHKHKKGPRRSISFNGLSTHDVPQHSKGTLGFMKNILDLNKSCEHLSSFHD